MADTVSKQLEAIQDNIRHFISTNTLTQDTAFMLGSTYADIGTAIRASKEQEKAYTSMCAMYLARNPKKVSSAIKSMVDTITCKDLANEDSLDETKWNVFKGG